jgi:hypothetical protein
LRLLSRRWRCGDPRTSPIPQAVRECHHPGPHPRHLASAKIVGTSSSVRASSRGSFLWTPIALTISLVPSIGDSPAAPPYGCWPPGLSAPWLLDWDWGRRGPITSHAGTSARDASVRASAAPAAVLAPRAARRAAATTRASALRRTSAPPAPPCAAPIGAAASAPASRRPGRPPSVAGSEPAECVPTIASAKRSSVLGQLASCMTAPEAADRAPSPAV